MPQGLWDLKFPDQGWNPCPLQWKCRDLTTEPPGNSLEYFRFFYVIEASYYQGDTKFEYD